MFRLWWRQLWCSHIPVRAEWPDGHCEYFCQECTKTMTEKEWRDYFGHKETK